MRPLEAFCLIFLLFARYAKSHYRNFSETQIVFFRIQIALTIISMANIILCMFLEVFTYPILSAIIRPLVIVCELPKLRRYMYNFGRLIYDSSTIVLFVIGWLCIWATVFQFNYKGTLQGLTYF